MDPVWIAVLLLTRKMMKGGENLYYYDRNSLKLTDAKLMNQMLSDYPLLRKQIEGMLAYEFPLLK